MNARRELDERFADWVDGRLTREQQLQLEAEIAADPELERAASEYRRFVLAMRARETRIEVPRAFADAVLARIPDPAPTPAGGRRFRLLPYAASGLAAAVIVSLLLVVNRLQPRPSADVPSVESSAKVPVAQDPAAVEAVQEQLPGVGGAVVRKLGVGDGQTAAGGAAPLTQGLSKPLGGGGGGEAKGDAPARSAPAQEAKKGAKPEELKDELEAAKPEAKGEDSSASGLRRAEQGRQLPGSGGQQQVEQQVDKGKQAEKLDDPGVGRAWLEEFFAGHLESKALAPDARFKDAKEPKAGYRDPAGSRGEPGELRAGLSGEPATGTQLLGEPRSGQSPLGELVLTVRLDETQPVVADQLRARRGSADSDDDSRRAGAPKGAAKERSQVQAKGETAGAPPASANADSGLARDTEQLFFTSLLSAPVIGNRLPPVLELWSRPLPLQGTGSQQVVPALQAQESRPETAPPTWRRDAAGYLALVDSRPQAAERRDRLLGMRGDREQVQAFVRDVLDLAKQLQGRVSVERELSFRFAPELPADSEADTGSGADPATRAPAGRATPRPEPPRQAGGEQLGAFSRPESRRDSREQSVASRPTDEMTVWVRVLSGR